MNNVLIADSKDNMLSLLDRYVPRRYQGKTLKKVRNLVLQASAADEFILRDDGHNLTLTINFPT